MKLTIITVNLNNKDGLIKTIQSINDQIYKDFEFVVIDGGSIDGSTDILEENKFIISKLISEKDNGIYNAMNKGILNSGGDYLFFLNSGDVFKDSHILSNVIDHLGTTDILYGDVVTTGGQIISPPQTLKFSYFYSYTICQQAIFFRSKLFTKFGYFDENLKIVSDWKFLLEVLFRFNVSYKKLNIVISIYDTNGISSLHENKMKLYNERQSVLKSDFKGFCEDYNELNFLKYFFIKTGLNFFIKFYRKLFK